MPKLPPRSFLDGYFWYLGPFTTCKNKYFDHPSWTEEITLPWESLPRTDADEIHSEIEEKSQSLLPPDGWQGKLGCFSCGLVDTYNADDVECALVPKPSEGVFHSDGACFCVEGRCVGERCKAPVRWYVDTRDATEGELLQRLRQNHFFGELPCGHNIKTMLDKSSLRTSRQMNRLWPKPKHQE